VRTKRQRLATGPSNSHGEEEEESDAEEDQATPEEEELACGQYGYEKCF
jgi:hypothetical protein